MMQSPQSKDYFERRAEEEQTAAETAADERAAHSHRELSQHYRKMASGSEELPPDAIEDGDAKILSKDFQIVP